MKATSSKRKVMGEMVHELIKEIKELKKEKDAVILVHNYQRPEIYEIADHIEDSLGLAKAATKSTAGTIVMCGVDFMAETAKILNPDKRVLLPDREANCPLALTISSKDVLELRDLHPRAAVMCYVNTMASVKAVSDYCCTSMNMVKIINSIPEDEIIFVPDQNMAAWAQEQTKKRIIPWKGGHCYVHAGFTPEAVMIAKKNHPNAKVVAHPECPLPVLKMSDYVTGTGGMIKFTQEDKAKEFIILTEAGMVHRLQQVVPNKTFYSMGKICMTQKKITLDKVRESLLKGRYEIKIPDDVLESAQVALDRMMEYS